MKMGLESANIIIVIYPFGLSPAFHTTLTAISDIKIFV